jgi:hypothetical protein
MKPWSTKMQVSWSPMASCSSTAVTAESTPPDSPQITRSKPTWRLMRWIASSLNDAMVQSPRQPQISSTKLPMSRAPSGVCMTSGWNCTP